jgi:tRNA (guanine-N(7)-)-methyltransferase subunit TRM82
MPKRPCAVLVTPDNKTILCGDKFGDVYSLPLFPSAFVEKAEDISKTETKEDASSKKYVPAATTLTVHSGRNRRALENQMKQKDLQAKAREGPKFEFQLLLGHVSMLTDVKFATEEVDGKTRGYIITADRDEHIRISRGPPQAYIIEGFCLGHKDFISKICLLPGTELLVSGGGDDWLGVWDWRAGSLKEKRDLRSALTTLFSSQSSSNTNFGAESPIAVSGLWTVPSSTETKETAVLVACERFPCLLVTQQGSASRMTGVSLPGVPLDVAVVGNTVIVSLDVTEVRQFSTDLSAQQSDHTKASTPRLQAYTVRNTESETVLELDEGFSVKLNAANNLMLPAPERKQLDNLLYGIENLRKRGAPEEAQDAASEQAIDGAISETAEDAPVEE